jgi:NAD(P)-dependent dehydrogenase (short-subunit alcohol dehydrogenase family)
MVTIPAETPEPGASGLLTGRVAIVTGGGSGLGRDLALGLADAGAAIAVIGPSGAEDAVAAAIESDGGRAVGIETDLAEPGTARAAFVQAAAALGPIDVVVHALVDPAALVPAPLADTGGALWDLRCEAVLRAALACLPATFECLAGRDGRVVVVTPTVALTGAAGLVPFATAAEGLRALAKSAARQWGEQGIAVNCVAPPVGLLAPSAGPSDPAIEAPALGRAPDGRADVAPVVAMLASAPARFVTGATLVVDGGVVMAP